MLTVPRAVGELIEVLPKLPEDLAPKAEVALRLLTGQDFGPRAGDDLSEVAAALRKWRQWWKENGSK